MRREEGFVTVALAGLVLVLVGLAIGVTALAAVGVARHRAQAAADLSALAAARHVREGQSAACAVAGSVAAAQAARLESCRVRGADVSLVVSVRPAGWLGRMGMARARADAGPATGTDRD